MVQGYPLRPEMMESTYLMYCATGDPALLQVLLPMLLPVSLDKEVRVLLSELVY